MWIQCRKEGRDKGQNYGGVIDDRISLENSGNNQGQHKHQMRRMSKERKKDKKRGKEQVTTAA